MVLSIVETPQEKEVSGGSVRGANVKSATASPHCADFKRIF